MVCVGSLHWDYLGRSNVPISRSEDRPGIVSRSVGGVAFNVARALINFGFAPELVSAVGSEAEGDELIRAADACGLCTSGIVRPARSNSDSCLVIEDPEGMVATVADCRLIEAVGAELVGRSGKGERSPLLGSANAFGHVVLDCNLPENALIEFADGNAFPGTDLSLVSASIGKIDRALILRNRPGTALYANFQEARALLSEDVSSAAEGAKGLVELGFDRAIVTNGSSTAADAMRKTVCEHNPDRTGALRYTGAGDRFTAAHIAAKLKGKNQSEALAYACECAGAFVSIVEEQGRND